MQAGSVEKQSIGMIAYPSFRSPHLFGRLIDGISIPALPIEARSTGVRKLATLIRKDNETVAEDDKEITDLFSTALISVGSRV
jgi:hypothetical protein